MPSAPPEQDGKKSQHHPASHHEDDHQCSVSDQITDSVAQTNVATMGAGPGFATIFRLYPAEGLGIAVLANATSLDREGIADRLYELFRL